MTARAFGFQFPVLDESSECVALRDSERRTHAEHCSGLFRDFRDRNVHLVSASFSFRFRRRCTLLAKRLDVCGYFGRSGEI